MLLFDENDKDLIIRYNVIFSSNSRGFISSKLKDLLANNKIDKDSISYNTPFTIAFISNNSPYHWGLTNGNSKEDRYVREKAGKIDTSNLSLLFKSIKNMGKLDELYTYLATKPHAMDDYFVTTYPDIAHFSTAFPLVEFTPMETMSVIAGRIDVKNFGDESDREVLDSRITTATNNTEVVKRLNLRPNIRK